MYTQVFELTDEQMKLNNYLLARLRVTSFRDYQIGNINMIVTLPKFSTSELLHTISFYRSGKIGFTAYLQRDWDITFSEDLSQLMKKFNLTT